MAPGRAHRCAGGLLLVAVLSTPPDSARAEGPALGEALDAATLTAIDSTVFPDGRGLPAGSGSVAEGRVLFEQRCAVCHGAGGRGASAPELAGGEMGLTGEWPDKIVGTYWPHATTLFDFIRRAMPMTAPGSLSADQVYALTAYVLFLNDIVPETGRLDAEALAAVQMPNRDGFIWIDAPRPR